MKNWTNAKDFIHDASGIEDPDNWIWKAINGIYYPVAQLETYRFAGEVHVMYTLDNVLYEGNVHLKTNEHGGENYEVVDFIEWDDNVLDINEKFLGDDQDIVKFLDAYFVDYIQDAETL